MICHSIDFLSFRNIEKEKCTFSNGVNVLYGKNAQGKSNMLEGVYFFARGKSFRGAKEKELIHFGEKSSSLSLNFKRDEDSHSITLSADIPSVGKKTLKKNGGKLSGTKEMMGIFRAVLFCPAHLNLVSGGGTVRRSFLDIALSQLYPSYLDSLSKYNKILIQRNSLIKSAKDVKTDMNVWEAYAEQMSCLASDIAYRRYTYISQLEKYTKTLFSSMTDGREAPSLSYRSNLLLGDNPEDIKSTGKDNLFHQLSDNIEREIKYGATLFGTHKDDFDIKLNGKEAKLFASQGQQRSLALSFKLAEGEISRETGGEYPVFLLDDVLSELDFERRYFVLSKLSGRQIIVTSCEPDLFQGGGDVRLIHIENGRIAETF